MDNIKISIICPVYKAEAYLNICINSILSQTFRNWELILIDDGSPDESGQICDFFASKDNRIKVIHKTNAGVSAARQDGLNISSGEYIIHIDPDDWIEPDMLTDMYNRVLSDNLDMLICDFFEDTQLNSIIIKQEPSNLNHLSVFKDLFINLHGSCCNKLVRKELFTKYNISFPNNYTYLEDLYVILKLCKHPITIGYLPKAYYHYIQDNNPNSLVHKPTKSKAISTIEFCKEFEVDMKKLGIERALYHYKYEAKVFALQCGKFSNIEFKNLFHEINNEIIHDAYKNWRTEPWKIEIALSLYIPNKIARFISCIISKITKTFN